MTRTIDSTPKSWRVISIAYAIFLSIIMIMAYIGIIPTKFTTYPQTDKIGHFILVGLAAFLLHKVLNKKKIIKNKIALGPLLIIIAFAIDEYAQLFSANRSCNIYDFMANVSGVIFFMLIEKRWPEIGPTWAIEKLQRMCAFVHWQLGRLKEKN